MIFDDIILDDIDDELSEKEKKLYLLTSMNKCHTKNKKQGVTNGGSQKYDKEQ